MRRSAFAALVWLLSAPVWAGSAPGKIKAIEPLKPGLTPHSVLIVNALTALAPLPPQNVDNQTLAQLEPISVSAPAPLKQEASETRPDMYGAGVSLVQEDGKHVLKINYDGDALQPHPFELLVPPNLGALDTREARAKNAVINAPAFMPAFIGNWLGNRRSAAIKSERLMTEEMLNQESLVKAHALIKSGDPQAALDELTASFESPRAREWYARNADHKPYWEAGMAYYRAIEKGLKRDLTTVKKRSTDATLVGEANGAGVWRPTQIQARHSGHCAFHAWHNAISASVGWVGGASVTTLIEAVRTALNEKTAPVQVNSQTAREFGLRDKPRDLGDGLTDKETKKVADWLGVPYRVQAAPRREQDLLKLLNSGQQVIQVLRIFHDNSRLEPETARMLGHDHPVGHHAAFVLGAFKSAKLGRWVYVVQDSGSGTTDFYTFDEFRHLTKELEILSPKGPVAIPAAD